MANIGIAPLDPTTPAGQVRLLIGDTDPTNIVNGRGTYLFYGDDELTALVGLYNTSVFRTAVRVLRNIAGSEALKLKKWTSAQLSVDGTAITSALNALADSIEADDRYGVMVEASEYIHVVATGGHDQFAYQARTNDEIMWLFRSGYFSGIWPDYYGMRDYLADGGGRGDFFRDGDENAQSAAWNETNGII